MKAKQKRVELLVSLLSFVYQQYNIWFYLNSNKKFLPKDHNFQNVLLNTLLRGYILGLASLLDPLNDSSGNLNISIYLIDDADVILRKKENKGIIGKVTRLRSKCLAHNDLDYTLEPEMISKLNLTHNDTDLLFKTLLKIVIEYANKNNIKHTIEDLPLEIERSAEEYVKKMLSI